MNINIIQGDCLIELPKIPDNSIDMVLIDPPYPTLTSKSPVGGKHKIMTEPPIFQGVGYTERIFMSLFTEVAKQLFRVVKLESHLYCMSNEHNLRNIWDTIEAAGWTFNKLLIWDKKNYILGPHRNWSPQCEYILFCSKISPHDLTNGKRGNIISISKTRQQYPTQKPIELFELLVEEGSRPGETILDCFCGSGTTGVACKNLGRNTILIDSSAKAIEITRQRTQ